MKTLLSLCVVVTVTLLATIDTRGQSTVYNRTSDDIYLAFARYNPAGSMTSTTGGDSVSWPTSVKVDAWFKVTRYGGSIKMPQGTVYMLISKNGKFYRLVGPPLFVKLPVHTTNATSFEKKYDTGKEKVVSNMLASDARRLGLKLFYWTRHYSSRNTIIEITDDNLVGPTPGS